VSAPRLLGVNAGVVRDQVVNGASVPTAHVKAPLPLPWVVTPTGVMGDEVAAHTDHLYVFDHASYDFWSRELGVDRSAWPDGTFAENLTLDHLNAPSLHLGDVFALGGTRLVVTGPRIPCAKLTWRLGQPPSFMDRFRLSGHAGVYLGVLQPGEVAPGDRLELVERASASPTVGQIVQVASASAEITAVEHEVLAATLASPHLSRSARRRLEARVGAGRERERRAARAWQGWRSFVVGAPEAACEDILSYALTPADGGGLAAPEAGQHVSVRMAAADGEDVVRTWSLSEHREVPDRLRISVKTLEGGRGSRALALAAARGAPVQVRAPAGSMTLSTSSPRPLVMIAAGVGVTPFVAMAQAHLRRADPPPAWMFLTAPTTARTPFREELTALFDAAGEPHRLVRFLTRAGDEVAEDGVRHGRLSAAVVIEVLSGGSAGDGRAGRTVGAPWFEADHHLCGPPSFVREVREGLLAAGAQEERITAESFEPAHDAAPKDRRLSAAEVVFRGRGVRARWEGDESGTLLDLGESAGLALPFDCRSGSCHACVATLVSGEVDGAVLDGVDGRARVLLCSSWPRSREVVLEEAGG